jgi:hypothetical protein
MPGFGFGFGYQGSRRAVFPYGLNVPQLLTPSARWDGGVSSGFSAVPSDPIRTTAKPVCRLLVPDRQTITDRLVVGVFAAANNQGTLLDNLGLKHVTFYFEGRSVTVEAPSLRIFARPDGSIYQVWGWWVALVKPRTTEGFANLYVEAVPADPTMQNRMTGPFQFLLYDREFDFDLEVAASAEEITGSRYKTFAAAGAYLRSQAAQRPRLRFTEAGNYDLGSIGAEYAGAGFCTIEAEVPVTFRQDPPASEADFPRFRPGFDRLRFKGANITIDLVNTLELYVEHPARLHWFDGCNIDQTAGRDALWRNRPRTLIGWVFRDGDNFTDCNITAVNDWGDKA